MDSRSSGPLSSSQDRVNALQIWEKILTLIVALSTQAYKRGASEINTLGVASIPFREGGRHTLSHLTRMMQICQDETIRMLRVF